MLSFARDLRPDGPREPTAAGGADEDEAMDGIHQRGVTFSADHRRQCTTRSPGNSGLTESKSSCSPIRPVGSGTTRSAGKCFGDRRLHWLYAGQALQRLLLHAASSSVHASIYTQPLEVAAYRTQVARCLGLPGSPQVLLQLGHADITEPTNRRRTKTLLRSEP